MIPPHKQILTVQHGKETNGVKKRHFPPGTGLKPSAFYLDSTRVSLLQRRLQSLQTGEPRQLDLRAHALNPSPWDGEMGQ